jgi:hypothetical protein
VLITYLNITLPVKAQLPYRQEFYKKVKREFERRGEPNILKSFRDELE